jgi:beta-carotene hydroxylase
MPRYRADYRTLFWALVLFPMLPAIGLTWPNALGWLVVPALYLSYCAGVLTHNFIHVPVFTNRWANHVYGAWLSIFYGCPIAFWIPTHLENHHRFLDGPEDATRTTRLSQRHTLYQAIRYSLACARWQRPLIAAYVRRAHAARGRSWVSLRDQGLALFGAHAGVLALAVWCHGLALGTLCYALSFGLPALLAPPLMQFTNYVQHIHCDPASPDDHSRDFVSPLANWFVFDNGYHGIHHERPSVHWSRYAELHRARAPRVHASLQQHNLLSFCLEHYLLGPLRQRRSAPRPREA